MSGRSERGDEDEVGGRTRRRPNNTGERVMIRKLLTTGFLGLFGLGLFGMVGAGVAGMVTSTGAKPAVKRAPTLYKVEFTHPQHQISAWMGFSTRSEAEQFAKVQRQHGYTVTITE